MSFERLIRFIDGHGRQLYGEPLISSADELQEQLAKGILKARVLDELEGRWLDFRATDPEQCVFVKQILGPLDAEHVPIIRCIGLNYMKHSK